jgi:integrase/recombinase XerD
MSVTLRKKQNADGTTSLYLDVYHNKKRYYEFLHNLKLDKPSVATRQKNKENLHTAQQIANKRAVELDSNDYNITPTFKKKVDFMAYLQSYIDGYTKKDKRVMLGVQKSLIEFNKNRGLKSITVSDVSVSYVEDFKEHLQANFNGETPATYFARFKKVIKKGFKEKLFKEYPAMDIFIKKDGQIKKDVLNFDEITLLAETPMTNEQVKNAFIFSLFTGLRFVDVKALQWSNIDLKAAKMNIKQSKTGVSLTTHLHETAIKILKSQKGINDPFVFKLPSHNACLKDLAVWTKKAKIEKHITWHCARHSFGTNLSLLNVNSFELSQLMGHTTMTYTQKYVRVAEIQKQKAIDILPTV